MKKNFFEGLFPIKIQFDDSEELTTMNFNRDGSFETISKKISLKKKFKASVIDGYTGELREFLCEVERSELETRFGRWTEILE